MTENQRNYLADLAGRKGVRLFDTDNWSVAHASEEIERLKTLPDAEFDEVTPEEIAKVEQMAEGILAEMNKWGFVRGEV